MTFLDVRNEKYNVSLRKILFPLRKILFLTINILVMQIIRFSIDMQLKNCSHNNVDVD